MQREIPGGDGVDEPVLLSEREDGVAILTLNRPEQMNTLSSELMSVLTQTLADVADDARVRCVVLRGNGKLFCAGGDVSRAVGRDGSSKNERTPEQIAAAEERAARRGPETLESYTAWVRNGAEASRLLHRMKKPTIAAVHGAAAGAGLALACACDLRVVAKGTKFNTAFLNVGFPGDYGGSYFLTQLLGPAKTRELYFLSEKFDADEAQRLGLVTRLVDAEALHAETMKLAHRMAGAPRITLHHMKTTLNHSIGGTLEEVLDLEAAGMARCRQTSDHKEAAKAYFEKRAPQFTGT
jgi:2-(1,2-epoxy-1,2-dihydrophenyl)acetyl-CoA isomerase